MPMPWSARLYRSHTIRKHLSWNFTPGLFIKFQPFFPNSIRRHFGRHSFAIFYKSVALIYLGDFVWHFLMVNKCKHCLRLRIYVRCDTRFISFCQISFKIKNSTVRAYEPVISEPFIPRIFLSKCVRRRIL